MPTCTTRDSASTSPGRAPGGLTWLDDRHYVERYPGGAPMRVEATTGERTPLLDVARLEEAIAGLPGVSADEARRSARRSGHVFNGTYTALVLELESDLYHYDIEGGRISRLTESPAAETEGVLQPRRPVRRLRAPAATCW